MTTYSVSTDNLNHAVPLIVLGAILDEEDFVDDSEAADAIGFLLEQARDYIASDGWVGLVRGVKDWEIALLSLNRFREELEDAIAKHKERKLA